MNTLSEENSLFNFKYDFAEENNDFDLDDPAYELNDSILSPDFGVTDYGMESTDTNLSQNVPFDQRTMQSSRKNKKDDFDYNTYIKAELVKMKATDMDPSVKKRMIQKIRNRMSAQRSRQRQKSMLQILEKENKELKLHNLELFKRLNEAQKENNKLKEHVKTLESSKKSASTSDNEETLSHSSTELTRENRRGSYAGLRNVFLVLVAIVAVAFVPMSAGDNSGVKMGGVVPFFATQTPASHKASPSIESYCRKYCTKEEGLHWGLPTTHDRALELYDENAKWLSSSDKDTSTLVCFDPRSKTAYRDAFRVVVNNATMSYIDPAHSYYGAFSRVEHAQ